MSSRPAPGGRAGLPRRAAAPAAAVLVLVAAVIAAALLRPSSTSSPQQLSVFLQQWSPQHFSFLPQHLPSQHSSPFSQHERSDSALRRLAAAALAAAAIARAALPVAALVVRRQHSPRRSSWLVARSQPAHRHGPRARRACAAGSSVRVGDRAQGSPRHSSGRRTPPGLSAALADDVRPGGPGAARRRRSARGNQHWTSSSLCSTPIRTGSTRGCSRRRAGSAELLAGRAGRDSSGSPVQPPRERRAAATRVRRAKRRQVLPSDRERQPWSRHRPNAEAPDAPPRLHELDGVAEAGRGTCAGRERFVDQRLARTSRMSCSSMLLMRNRQPAARSTRRSPRDSPGSPRRRASVALWTRAPGAPAGGRASLRAAGAGRAEGRRSCRSEERTSTSPRTSRRREAARAKVNAFAGLSRSVP